MNRESENLSGPPDLANDPRLPGLRSLALVDASAPVALGSAPPDWRWRRITFLHQQRVPANRPEDDDWICRGLAYVQEVEHWQTLVQKDRLAEHWPDIHAAVVLQSALPPLSLAVLQARLLAGIPLEDTAALCSMPLPTVTALEALFFNVQTRRAHAVSLQFEVIASDVWIRHARGDHGEVLKLLGLFHGREAVEAGIRLLVENRPSLGDRRVILPILMDGLRRHWALEAAKVALGDASSTSDPVAGLFSLFPRWARYTSPLREMPGRPKARKQVSG